MTFSILGLFAIALLINSGSPGPSIAALVSRVIAKGWRDVIPFIAAMWIGEVLWLLLALAGLSALAQTFEGAFQVLKYAGVAYLLWLAWQMWHQSDAPANGPLPNHSNRWAMFGSGLALTLGNPKIIVFYVALLPTLIDIDGATYGDWALLALVTMVCLACVDLAWTALAHRARLFLQTPKAIRVANRLGATTLASAAAVIATR